MKQEEAEEDEEEEVSDWEMTPEERRSGSIYFKPFFMGILIGSRIQGNRRKTRYTFL